MMLMLEEVAVLKVARISRDYNEDDDGVVSIEKTVQDDDDERRRCQKMSEEREP